MNAPKQAAKISNIHIGDKTQTQLHVTNPNSLHTIGARPAIPKTDNNFILILKSF